MNKKYVFISIGKVLCHSFVDYFPIIAHLDVFCSLHTVLADYTEKTMWQVTCHGYKTLLLGIKE